MENGAAKGIIRHGWVLVMPQKRWKDEIGNRLTA